MNGLGLQLRDGQWPGQREAPTDGGAADAAWHVLEAANELDDEDAVAACRRVIDASLNGRPPAAADLHLVIDYFR